MKKFLIALQFLTIFPLKIKSEIKEKDLGESLLFFPLVGLLIGSILSVTSLFFDFLPNLVSAVLILIISAVITGGIHLDGFADTCDGFYETKSKAEILEIMRDSRIGVMGVIGLVTLLLLKFALIVSIPYDCLWKSLIMMAAFSRWSQVLACYTSSYVRKEGKAKFFINYAKRKDVIKGGVFIFVLFLLTAGFKGILIFISAFLPVVLFIWYVKRKLGGMTGDTIGAVNEIAEAGVLFSMLCCY